MANKKAIQFDHIGINFTAAFKDENGEQQQYAEQISLGMHDEADVNRKLKEKPYLIDLIAAFIARANENHDPKKEHLQKLKAAIGQ